MFDYLGLWASDPLSNIKQKDLALLNGINFKFFWRVASLFYCENLHQFAWVDPFAISWLILTKLV